ncbi:D-alanyl-D-alanine carboxypeptidase/D-alanyl-D-alanine-endopeptidase [Dyadobacter sp. 32]|uniref:D-alanyl-D-alanine carboxypeptidase/D-alanyl-D-alanine endopeptidase n=1 Tax=Dyadobacter sp. 32 TaxID=538966 RepID=UPI0039C714EE
MLKFRCLKVCIALIWSVMGQESLCQPVDSLRLSNFEDAVLELQNSDLLRYGTLSVAVKNAKEGQNIFSLNPTRSLPSASTLKLVTTASALSMLGGDFRYTTYLEYDGEIRRDTLHGNLYIRGMGDPSLGSDRFKDYPNAGKMANRWAASAQKAGIRIIKGKVIADNSFFEGNTVADSWIYADLGNYYGAGVNGLNFNENLYRLKFKPAATSGDPAPLVTIDPMVPGLDFSNFVSTGERGSGDQVIVYNTPLQNNVLLRGTVPAGFATFTAKGSLPDPPKLAVNLLTGSLLGASVAILGLPDSLLGGALSGQRKVLDEYQSPPLRELCLQTNWWSINLYADSFLRLIGKRSNGKSDYDNASEAVASYWRSRNVDLGGFYIKDGSGLSPSASLTTQNLTQILAAATRETSFTDFYKSIAVMGVNGTVRNLGKGTKAAGNIRAKSGSIEGTRAYAGYVTSRSGVLLSFAMIAHKYQPENGRSVSDELVKLMTLLAEL